MPQRRPLARARPTPPKPHRPWLGPLAAALAFLAVVGGGLWWWLRPNAYELTAPSADQNVLLVTIDTLRGDALSSYGGPVRTPTLDALAARGARFTFAHAHAVVTLVSHTTILTGKLPFEHGVRDNSGFRVPEGTTTVATRLKAAGYATGAFVGGFPLTKRFGLSPGFDRYDDQLPEMHGDVEFSMPERRANVVVGRALDWMGRQTGRFFAWVHVFDPHAPYRPPPEYLAQYPSQPYYGAVAFVDHALGPLFDRLSSLSRPTFVIVTADHGESLGEHGEQTHGMFAYEATLRIPLIVAEVRPGESPLTSGNSRGVRGTVIDAPVAHIDIVPTVLDVLGLPPDRALRGRSLRDVIRTDRSPNQPGYFEAMSFNLTRGWAPLRGVLVGRDKFIDLPIPELYDLLHDPHEEQNEATTGQDRLPAFRADLRTLNTALPNRPSQESPEVSRPLRSLGYVSGSAPAKATYTAEDDPKRLVNIDHEFHDAQQLYEHGQASQALVRLRQVVASQPKMGDAAVYLAYVYWEGGQPQEAIRTLETAVAAGVPDNDVQMRLGIYLAESGINPQRAIKLLEALPVTDVEALNGLGVAYEDAGRPNDAVGAFKRILTLDSTNGLALQNIARVELEEARKIDNPNDPRRVAALRDAEAVVRQALEVDPSLPSAYTTLGGILEYTGRRQEAIDAWKQAVTLDAQEFDALYDLVVKLADAGRMDEARTFGDRFLANAPPALHAAELAEVRRLIGR